MMIMMKIIVFQNQLEIQKQVLWKNNKLNTPGELLLPIKKETKTTMF